MEENLLKIENWVSNVELYIVKFFLDEGSLKVVSKKHSFSNGEEW